MSIIIHLDIRRSFLPDTVRLRAALSLTYDGYLKLKELLILSVKVFYAYVYTCIQGVPFFWYFFFNETLLDQFGVEFSSVEISGHRSFLVMTYERLKKTDFSRTKLQGAK